MMNSRILILCALSLVLLSGCAVGDFLNRDVELNDAKAKVAQMEATVETTTKGLAAIKAQLAEARALVAQTGSETAIKVVAQLERAAAVTEAALPHLRDAVAQAGATVKELEASGAGSVKVWHAGLAALLPWIPRLVAMIPGVGVIAAPIAGAIGQAAFSSLVTKRQREEDELTQKRSSALSAQTDVAGEALASLEKLQALVARPGVSVGGLPEALLKQQGITPAQDIKDAARAKQELAGLYAVIRAEVLRQEAEAPVELLRVEGFASPAAT